MTVRFKNATCYLVAAVLSLLLAACAYLALPCPALASDYLLVSDSAGVLSKSEAQTLEKQAEKLTQKYDLSVFVTYVDKMSKSKVRDSAIAEYKAIERDASSGDELDGAMLYVAVDDRQMVTITRGSAIDMFTDGRIDETEEAVASNLSDDDWYGAAETYLDLTEETLSYYDENGEAMWATDGREVDFDYDDSEGNWLIILGAALIIGLLAAFVTRKVLKVQLKSVEAGHDANLYQTGDVHITASSEHFMGTTVTRVPLPDNDSSGGGGHISSSGGFGGSGGRGF